MQHYKPEEPLDLNYRTYQLNEDGEIITVDIDAEEQYGYNQKKEAESLAPTDYELEAGYYDSDGKLHYGKFKDAVTPYAEQKRDIRYTLDEIRSYEASRQRKPSVDNPFMNPSVDEFNTEKAQLPVMLMMQISAMKSLNSSIKIFTETSKMFFLERTLKDNSIQSHIMSLMIKRDLARWCYKFPKNCKTDQEYCLKYQDLRIKYE